MEKNAKNQLYLSEGAAAWQAKCPRCRRGDMFSNSMYGFNSQKMNDQCPHCKLKFEREPGYFYVSMFVSYAFNVAELVTFSVALYILTGSENFYAYLSLLLVTTFALSPFNFRYSRVVLLYWLTPGLNFDPNKSKDLIKQSE